MKKFIFIGIITLLLSSTTKSFSQSIDLSADSITTLLCKKWQVDYAMMGNMKIARIPEATEIDYEFNKDKTFLMTSTDPKDKIKGMWVYDTKKKIIRLTINGKSNTSIVSLKEEELIMLADTRKATPDDPMEVKLIYKIRAK